MQHVIHAIEMIHGSPPGIIDHGIFLTQAEFDLFEASWKSTYKYGSDGLTAYKLDIPSRFAIVDGEDYSRLCMFQGEREEKINF